MAYRIFDRCINVVLGFLLVFALWQAVEITRFGKEVLELREMTVQLAVEQGINFQRTHDNAGLYEAAGEAL